MIAQRRTHTWQTLNISPWNAIECSHTLNPAPSHTHTHTSLSAAWGRERGDFVNIPTKLEVTLLKEKLYFLRTRMKKLFVAGPKNVVKCLLFSAKVYGGGGTLKGRSRAEEWVIKFFGRGGDGGNVIRNPKPWERSQESGKWETNEIESSWHRAKE